ncbi:Fic family protein [Pedobacter metabolipauper]|uniref:Fic family protein n=1 Tax=Pedobacter metabolipauper TaxID=425513 RepID=A0A4R6SV06_9SPHI|nr:Fic family protein [Pedobacter metabolipauper]TDQ08876.1 Fic family protein [Pedobacter metabolipauper]
MKKVRNHTENLLAIINSYPNGININEVAKAFTKGISTRSLQRLLLKLSNEGRIMINGAARSTKYHPIIKEEERQEIGVAEPAAKFIRPAPRIIPLSDKGKYALTRISTPIQQRIPVGYQQNFLKSYQPNIDSYLSGEEKKHLAALGNTGIDRPAGTYVQQILNRLLIDLSWNSSRLEGNTYSLLDTERLILQGQADDSKSAKEAQMILNHKDAIEFIVQAAQDIGFNRYTFLNLHAMLANNLLTDLEAPGRLRSMAVGITGSTYIPLAIPQLIGEYFDLILEKAKQIENPFEQSFFLMVHLPYLQPFDDVNKRVSRLAANIPLIKQNLSPLSFIDVPEDLYFKGMMAVYEHNDINLLKEVFLWAYERSAQKYAVIRQSIGEPDIFKLKYRDSIRNLITTIIINELDSKDAQKRIKINVEELPKEDREQFISSVETELMAIHEGNFARYRVSQREFFNWQKIWNT